MKKLILGAVFALACLSMAVESRVLEVQPEANFGYEPPPSVEERHELYGDDAMDKSLSEAHPELFKEDGGN